MTPRQRLRQAMHAGQRVSFHAGALVVDDQTRRALKITRSHVVRLVDVGYRWATIVHDRAGVLRVLIEDVDVTAAVRVSPPSPGWTLTTGAEA